MNCYADTSFIFSLYVPDANSVSAANKAAKMKSPLVVTDFSEFEFINALQLRVFRRELKASEVSEVLTLFRQDVSQGVFRVLPLPGSAFRHAIALANRHTAQLGSRGLDILHVAAALALRCKIFFTFDRAQSALARAAGLTLG